MINPLVESCAILFFVTDSLIRFSSEEASIAKPVEMLRVNTSTQSLSLVYKYSCIMLTMKLFELPSFCSSCWCVVTYSFPLANNSGFQAELVRGRGFVKEVNLIGRLDVQRITNYNLPKQIQGKKKSTKPEQTEALNKLKPLENETVAHSHYLFIILCMSHCCQTFVLIKYLGPATPDRIRTLYTLTVDSFTFKGMRKVCM